MRNAPIDAELLLATAQTVTSDAAGNVSAGYVDLDAIINAQLSPQALQVNFDVGTALLTSARSYKLRVESDNDSHFSSPSNMAEIIISTAAGNADNKVYAMAFSPTRRCVRAYFDVSAVGGESIVINKVFLSPVKY